MGWNIWNRVLPTVNILTVHLMTKRVVEAAMIKDRVETGVTVTGNICLLLWSVGHLHRVSFRTGFEIYFNEGDAPTVKMSRLERGK